MNVKAGDRIKVDREYEVTHVLRNGRVWVDGDGKFHEFLPDEYTVMGMAEPEEEGTIVALKGFTYVFFRDVWGDRPRWVMVVPSYADSSAKRVPWEHITKMAEDFHTEICVVREGYGDDE